MDDIVVTTSDSIGTVRLNRPERGNSVTPDVVARMGDAVSELAATEEIDAIVLTGTGRVFCAGADVNEMYAIYLDSGADGLCEYLIDIWMPAVQRTVRLLWSAAKPLIAACNGAATAGGLDFSLACDVRVASTTARFAESYVNLGMVPVAGGTFLLPLRIGMGPASELLASGELIGAERARELGIVEYVVAPEDLDARARELAFSMSRGPGATFLLTRQIVRGTRDAELHDYLRRSYEANIELLARDDVRRRVVSVMERYADAPPPSAEPAEGVR